MTTCDLALEIISHPCDYAPAERSVKNLHFAHQKTYPMQFLTSPTPPQSIAPIDTVTLVIDPWDDYGYRTKFSVYVAQKGGEHRWLGDTKILARAYPAGQDYKQTSTILPTKTEKLDPSKFCSLGQDLSYYKRLGQLSNGLGHKIAHGLNDVMFSATQDWWTGHPGFDTSLLRVNSACLARIDARAVFDGKEAERDIRHQIRYHRAITTDGGPKVFEVNFDGSLKVPGRLNVVIGKNGTGKTSLLAGLAEWFSKPISKDKFSYRPHFSRVVVVTFNPFDTAYRSHRVTDSNVEFVGRRPISEEVSRKIYELTQGKIEKEDWKNSLLEVFPTQKIFQESVGSLLVEQELATQIEKLRNEPGWLDLINQAFDDSSIISAFHEDPEAAVASMSAGQRLLASLYAALFEKLDRQALVLIDEPENHLHPSLIAQFIRTFNQMLDQRRAYAIIVTHSPVVLQETPSKFVKILERIENETTAREPDFETFGESIDNITEKLFETDFRSSHWKQVLRQLVEEGSDVEAAAQEISGKPLPLLAGTYFSYYRSRRG